jgi:hypothetical protein
MSHGLYTINNVFLKEASVEQEASETKPETQKTKGKAIHLPESLKPLQQELGIDPRGIFKLMSVKQRAILTRLGGETASKSFHPIVPPSGVLTGGIWSDLYGHHLRNSTTSFSTETIDFCHCPGNGSFPTDRTQTSQYCRAT